MKSRLKILAIMALLIVSLALAQQQPKASPTIALDATEIKAVEDWETASRQLATQWDTALGELITTTVDCQSSMAMHAKVKDLAGKRAILTEQLKTLKQTHRLAHNCPTCEYQDTKTMVRGEVK